MLVIVVVILITISKDSLSPESLFSAVIPEREMEQQRVCFVLFCFVCSEEGAPLSLLGFPHSPKTLVSVCFQQDISATLILFSQVALVPFTLCQNGAKISSWAWEDRKWRRGEVLLSFSSLGTPPVCSALPSLSQSLPPFLVCLLYHRGLPIRCPLKGVFWVQDLV